jgi:hypothetical protein
MKASEITKVYNQYLADQQDGFVSNVDSYLESKLRLVPPREKKEIIREIKKRYRDDNLN